MNKVHKGATTRVLPHFDKRTIANALNVRMCTDNRTVAVTATVGYNKIRPRKLLQSYAEVVDYLLKQYASEAAIVLYDATKLRYMHPASTTPQQFADKLIAESCKVTDVYDESGLKDVYIEGVEVPICYSLLDYWASHPLAGSTCFAFHMDTMLV